MKKTLLLIATLICLAFSAKAQDAGDTVSLMPRIIPNLEQIKQDIADPASEFYYPTLLRRFAEADTTLTVEQLQHFYLGYAYQPEFNPYGDFGEEDEIKELLGTDPSVENAKRIVALADEIISKKPTEVKAYYYKMLGMPYAYGEDDPRNLTVTIQLRMLLEAIYSSGDGTYEFPYYISTVNHSYFVMGMNDLRPKGQALVYLESGPCDRFPIAENDYGIDSLYFNIKLCFGFWSFLDLDNETVEATKPAKGLKEVTIPVGSHFVMRTEKLKNKKSQFELVEMESIDTVVAFLDKMGLDKKELDANIIEGYFVQCEHSSNDSPRTLLIIKSGTQDGATMLKMDTEILHTGQSDYESTSNDGLFTGVVSIEIWNNNLSAIRISNLRK